MDRQIKVEMHQREEANSGYVRICRRGRRKSHFGVTPASRRRLGKLISRQVKAGKFLVRPYVIETVGWVAASN